MLLNAAECHGYSFYRFWVIKGKPRGKICFIEIIKNVLLQQCWWLLVHECTTSTLLSNKLLLNTYLKYLILVMKVLLLQQCISLT